MHTCVKEYTKHRKNCPWNFMKENYTIVYTKIYSTYFENINSLHIDTRYNQEDISYWTISKALESGSVLLIDFGLRNCYISKCMCAIFPRKNAAQFVKWKEIMHTRHRTNSKWIDRILILLPATYSHTFNQVKVEKKIYIGKM
jgi:hypothetical protein